MAFLLSLTFGVAPMLAYAAALYWIDRYEKEPLGLLAGCFLWGATVAAGWSFILNTLVGVSVFLLTDSDLAVTLSTGSISAPIVEEISKALALLILFMVFRPELDTPLDGIVYGGIVGLGFAATENTLYIFNGFQESGYSGLLAVAFIRVVLIGFQHAFYTAFTGLGFALARLQPRRALQILAPLAGLAMAIAAHSLHNTLATLLPGKGLITFGTFVDWAGWLAMLGIILWALGRERSWIRRYLDPEVRAGVLSASQYRIALSPARRQVAALRALATGRARSTRRFYQLCAELAWKKHQASRLGPDAGRSATIDELRDELAVLSAQLKGA